MPFRRSNLLIIVVTVLMLLLLAIPIMAQSDPEPIPVTDDEVNDVASQMYCPICEMEPLHTCGASTCVLWRQQIRESLEAGETSEEIVDSFVERYGDRVVGIPSDPGLRALSLAGPIALGLLALIVGVLTFSQWRKRAEPITNSASAIHTDDDAYLSQLENDLRND